MRVRDTPQVLWLAFLAVLIEVAVRSIPLPRLASWLGVAVIDRPQRQPERSVIVDLTDAERRNLRISRALSRRWPFTDGPCLRESLLVGHVLRRHQPVLRIGVGQRDGKAQAHAWLVVNGATLGGTQGFSPFTFPQGTHRWS